MGNALKVAEDSVKAGQLEEAKSALIGYVKANPANVDARIFLAQLFLLLGQWSRAAIQLKTLRSQSSDTSVQLLAQSYSLLMKAEQVRLAVFAGHSTPMFLGEPAQWQAFFVEGLKGLGEGKASQADELFQQGANAAPAVSGQINGEPFKWLCDADPRIGPQMELFINGQYYWLPLDQVQTLAVEAPTDLRDLVWCPAALQLQNGGQLNAFLPVAYPADREKLEPQLQMARLTQWRPLNDALSIGEGQRLLATDEQDYALLEVRHIEIDACVEHSDG